MTTLPFYSPELQRGSEGTSHALDEVVAVLCDERVLNSARLGQLTLAMIRPSVGPDANVDHLDDNLAAERIEEQIENLGIVAKFSFRFDSDTIEEFYEGPSKESMKTQKPQKIEDCPNKWEEFKDLMTSGPTTALLLYSEDDAIAEWRDHLGHWNIEKTRDPGTIRGRMGVDNYNNLVHGSDAPESVIRELELIAGCIEAQVAVH